MTLFIGDVHGKYRQYEAIMRQSENTIQVGDMGVGFLRVPTNAGDPFPSQNPPHAKMVAGNHRFIRGNHDNPEVCQRQSQWIPDGRVEGDMMFVGGALSIDREWRTEGYDWWADEELSIDELYRTMDTYLMASPSVMVTHECPDGIAAIMCESQGRRKFDLASRTRQAFQSMWERYQPKVWVFGHWHESFDQVIDGTRFVCLAELETKWIEV